MKGENMTIDKSKLVICIVCDQTIQPRYLGKDRDGIDTYWYEGNNALPFLTTSIRAFLGIPVAFSISLYDLISLPYFFSNLVTHELFFDL